MTSSPSRHLIVIFSILVAGLLAVIGFSEKAKKIGGALSAYSSGQVASVKGAVTLSASNILTAAMTHKQKRRKPNRLLKESSPYLQQHGYNPIDWYPWGKEAFAKAKAEKKPIFLSVGYSTCHWCHVMEEESFSQQDIADILNTYFVAIKVDRERRPDLDERYMLATQIITGTGGWPNNLFLTPEQKPFFAGGYFPKDQFAKLLLAVSGQWNSENRSALEADGLKISALILKVMNRQEKAKELNEKAVRLASTRIMHTFDPFYGGFATAPKFPNEPTLMFLLRMAMKYDDKDARNAVIQTVDAILDGGIHDHVGGGFHRYAIDNAWLTPHFEKMLYNQAQMVRVLVRLYEMTGNPRYKQAAMRTLDFVLRDMTSPEGGFYSAYDADSKGGEGRFYTWSLEEIRAALPAKEAQFAISVFGISESGNFEGYNILHFPDSQKDIMKKLKLSPSDFDRRLGMVRTKLLAARSKRQRPHLDQKIIVSWNGMMMTAFAEAGRVFSQGQYTTAARKGFLFIENKMQADVGGELHRSWFDGKAGLPAQLSDYAALSVAALSLYDTVINSNVMVMKKAVSAKKGVEVIPPAVMALSWKKRAQKYLTIVERLFLDDRLGGYFMTAKKGNAPRLKKRDDSAVASGNALLLEAMAMMAARSGTLEMTEKADRLLVSMSGLMVKGPTSMAYALYAADLHLRGAVGTLSYGAKGHLIASSQPRFYINSQGSEWETVLNLKMQKGWHINANKPFEEDFIPTVIGYAGDGKGEKSLKIVYPKAVEKKLGFNSKKMALYEGNLDFRIVTDVKSGTVVPLKIKFQACSDKICLEPEEVLILFNFDKGFAKKPGK